MFILKSTIFFASIRTTIFKVSAGNICQITFKI